MLNILDLYLRMCKLYYICLPNFMPYIFSMSEISSNVKNPVLTNGALSAESACATPFILSATMN